MPKLTEYKALFFDIDRTLIPSSREIFPEVISMLELLDKNGYKIGVCSGRGFAGIQSAVLTHFPKNSIHVLAGGSLLISSKGEVFWQETINPSITAELKKMITEEQSPAIFMKPDAQYATPEVLINIQNHPWNQIGKPLSEMDDSGVGLIYVPTPSKKVESFITTHPELSYKDMRSSAGHRYLDVTVRGVTKAKALHEWEKISQISLSKVIGFGDSQNDIEFLQECGFSVAMGNADPDIKKLADRIIGPVHQKGLPAYIEKVLEGESL